MSAVDLEQEIANLLAPLRELQKVAQREEQEAQAKLDVARTRRREIDKMLRAVDPEAEPFHKQRNGGRPKKTTDIGAAKLDAVTEWLQERAEELNAMAGGDGFALSEVVEKYGGYDSLPIGYQSGMSKAFRELHERGVLRLSKVGGMGGRKYYKVVV